MVYKGSVAFSAGCKLASRGYRDGVRNLERVYHGRKFKTVEELKQTIVTEWKNISQRFIDSCINEWHRRLECVVKNGGGHIEHCNFVE